MNFRTSLFSGLAPHLVATQSPTRCSPSSSGPACSPALSRARFATKPRSRVAQAERPHLRRGHRGVLLQRGVARAARPLPHHAVSGGPGRRGITASTSPSSGSRHPAGARPGGLNGTDIDAWLVPAITAQAGPGVASLVKEYFCAPGHRSETRSLQAGCGSFSMMLRRRPATCSWRDREPPAHRGGATPITSVLILQPGATRPPCSPAAVWRRAVRAVIVSARRSGGRQRRWACWVSNDAGAGIHGPPGLEHDRRDVPRAGEVKKLAVQGMVESAQPGARRSQGLAAADVDWFVPHQTGNGIVNKTARLLASRTSRVHRDAQWRYGNVSGATVPVGLWCMDRAGQLKPAKWCWASAGVGGDIGAFLYRVPSARGSQKSAPTAGPARSVDRRSGAIGRETLATSVGEGAPGHGAAQRPVLGLDPVRRAPGGLW